jgi:hypothetical protein
MKTRVHRFFAVLASAALVLSAAGCSQLYTVTFTHGSTLAVRGKPTYDKATDTYTLRTADGRTGKVPAMSIREIAPVGMSSDEQPVTQPFKILPK